MLKSVTVTNFKGDKLVLDLFNPWSTGIIIQNIDGIGPGQADINTTEMATGDGAWYNSARLQTRNITMTLKPIRDPMVETNRHKIYRYFPVKTKVELEFITDERDLRIEGYVENCEPTIFSQNETVMVSILCPDPLFYGESSSEETFSGVRGGFEFPFSSESVETTHTDYDYNTNLLYNFNFTDPQNNYIIGNENLIPDSDLRYFPTLVTKVAALSEIKEGSWGYMLSPDGQGSATITTDGIQLNRNIAGTPGWIVLAYRYPKADFEQGDYTLSIVTKEHGLTTTTANLTLSSTGTIGNKDFGGDDQRSLYWDYNADGDILCCCVRAGLGAIATVQNIKFEHGTEQTLVATKPKTEWHAPGITIDGWYASGHYGNFNIELKKGEGLYIQDFVSGEEDFKLYQDVDIIRGSQVTLSVVVDKQLKTWTVDIPDLGAYDMTEFDLDNDFVIWLHCDEDKDRANLAITHPQGKPDASITVAGIKLEYGTESTLEKDGSILPEPPAEDFFEGEGTIEFGEIRTDTKASINYAGDSETGITIVLHATGPVEMITLHNVLTNETMTIDTDKIQKLSGHAFDQLDDIIINTKRSQRSIRYLHDGKYYNAITAIGRNSDWFTLSVGENVFAFECRSGDENLSVTFNYDINYGGV